MWAIAKLHGMSPPESILKLNEWYTGLKLTSKLRSTTKLMYASDIPIEGEVLGQVDPDGISSPYWRVKYPCTADTADDAVGGEDGCVFERSVDEVRDACWAWEAHHDGCKHASTPRHNLIATT